MEAPKIKYKYTIEVFIKKLEWSIPYKAKLGVRLVRGKKSIESKKKIQVNGGDNRNFTFNEKLKLITTLEYNPKLGCCEEKKANIRFITYKTSEGAKRIGDVSINISNFVKVPEYGSPVSNLKKYKETKGWLERMSKGLDRFAMCDFEVSSQLVEVDGDDTFSMYHGDDWDDTITDASWIEKNRPLTDRNYYAKPFEDNLKTKISIDISHNENEAKIVSEEKVDRFGNPLEKAIPLGLEDTPSPDKDWENNSRFSSGVKVHLDTLEEENNEKEEEIK